jgi:hypothetical protein
MQSKVIKVYLSMKRRVPKVFNMPWFYLNDSVKNLYDSLNYICRLHKNIPIYYPVIRYYLKHEQQTFQVSRNYREIHAFLFAFTHHAWSDFLPAFLNLSCRGFFLWGNYSHFFSFAQCPMHSFCQRQYPEVLRSLENVCLNRISKRDKKLGDAWAALFFAVWEGGATNKISYSVYSMNT